MAPKPIANSRSAIHAHPTVPVHRAAGAAGHSAPLTTLCAPAAPTTRSKRDIADAKRPVSARAGHGTRILHALRRRLLGQPAKQLSARYGGVLLPADELSQRAANQYLAVGAAHRGRDVRPGRVDKWSRMPSIDRHVNAF